MPPPSRLHLSVALATLATSAAAQPPATVTVRVSSGGAPVEHAVVAAGGGTRAAGAETNAAGLARLRLAAGAHVVRVSRIGYAPDSARVTLRAGGDTLLAFTLRDTAAALSRVVVTSTRGARRLEDEPARVEVLAGEDVAEKTEMRPQDLTGFLSEMGGVRLQRTSASTGAAGVRLQGLRSRYTLMLIDGLPLTPSGAGGLDLLQLPPADLKQVEVVKGPATALYGPAALGGTINLVSKRPGHGAAERERDAFVSASDQRGVNAFAWSSTALSERWGVTALAGAHAQTRRDMDGDGWSDLPGARRVELRPRLFYDAPDGSALLLTAGATLEDRSGGTAPGALTPAGRPYVETVDTRRGDVGVVGHRLAGAGLVQLRAAASVDRQRRAYATEPETDARTTGFAELSLAHAAGTHDLLAGAAVQAEHASVEGSWLPVPPGAPSPAIHAPVAADAALTYTHATASVFAQDAWTPLARLSFTASGRLDAHSRWGALWSPRVSALARLGGPWALRASVARGTSAPTPFVEETQAVGVRRVRGFGALRPETADYAALDLTGKHGAVELDATAFASRVSHAVQASAVDAAGTGVPVGSLVLTNAAGPVRTAGAELFAVYNREPFLVTALYTLTASTEPVPALDAPAGVAARRTTPFAPRQTGGLDLTWEGAETGTWLALEGFYTGTQALDDDPYRATGHPYTVVGALAAQQLGPVRVFVSAENLTDVRQRRWEPVFLPQQRIDGRWTATPWAPLEGRVVSVGVRVSAGQRPRGP